MCGNCKGKGHDAAACTSKGEGKHVPKGKGKGVQLGSFGGKGWGKGGKGFGGKGKGEGNISGVDDARSCRGPMDDGCPAASMARERACLASRRQCCSTGIHPRYDGSSWRRGIADIFKNIESKTRRE